VFITRGLERAELEQSWAARSKPSAAAQSTGALG
jgi:hypothetical protein